MLYTGAHLNQISFPLGGIGTGSIGLAGNGSLVDWEIFNRPAKGSLNPYTCFAIKAEFPCGKTVAKILQGDFTGNLTGQYSPSGVSSFGHGPDSLGMHGYPHFRKVRFDGQFPVATLTFEDKDFPAKVVLKAFNPFIPLDTFHSSIPAAFFEIRIQSQDDNIRYTVLLNMGNPFPSGINEVIENEHYTAVKLSHFGKQKTDLDYGDLTVAVDATDGICQEYWYRGNWSQDKVTTFWHEFSTAPLKNRHYNTPAFRDVCSVGAVRTLSHGEKAKLRFVLAWNIPNNYNYWRPFKDETGRDISWKNYYATVFADSTASCSYSLQNWDLLYKQTDRFRKVLHNSTLDKAVIDAVSSTLSVLKSPTVLRLEDGTFYGWEGLHERTGSCEGTCTHVWSYAYALCFLFPELERSLRETEFRFDTDPDGRMHFRSALPLDSDVRRNQAPCVDGQMATVIKIYRDWKLTGNTQWLRENWDNIKKVLEFAWAETNTYEWDRNKDGVLEGRQHHTLDVELFGPSSWLQSMYLAALKAAAEIAAYLGDTEKNEEYTQLFQKGFEWTKEHLFNGEYFFHRVDLQDRSVTEHFQCPGFWNEEKQQLIYQIGEGCALDQMLGQWHANICGLGEIFDRTQRLTALKSMLKNNFKQSMRDHPNSWRIFAINDERGCVICTYPEGKEKPVISIPYTDECMTGFEYAFAGLLISEGFIEDGLEVVRAIRDRYDGQKRNPWNEIECGSNYARSMASFALLPIFSGFTFDLPEKRIGFAPVLQGDFRCFWSLGTGWGEYSKTRNAQRITLASGMLELTSVTLGTSLPVKRVTADGIAIPFRQKAEQILFDQICIKKELRFEVAE